MFIFFLRNESYCSYNSSIHTASVSNSLVIDYKNIGLLRRYIGVTGKILAFRVTKLTSKEQRRIALAIRRARRTRLLPFVWRTDSK